MKPKPYQSGKSSSTHVAGGGHRKIRHGGSMKSGPKASHKNLAPKRGKTG